jgi:hypothetical protein
VGYPAKIGELAMIRFLFVAFTVCVATAASGQALTEEELSLERLNLAFCECLGFIYKDLDSVWIRDGSIAAYFELSSYGLEVIDTIQVLAETFSLKVYRSKDGELLGLMKCLDFYNSVELDSIVRSFDTAIDVGTFRTGQWMMGHNKRNEVDSTGP